MSFWESARDTPVWGSLYLSSQVWQPNKYSFVQTLMKYGNGAVSTPIVPLIGNWMTCPALDSKCADAAWTCCFGSQADLTNAKRTCRPGNSCFTLSTTTTTTRTSTTTTNRAATSVSSTITYSSGQCGAGIATCNSGLCCSQVFLIC